MCGFIGYLSEKVDNNPELETQIRIASKSIQSRGPDEETYLKESNLYLGFRRLAIQDIKNGSQPLLSRSRNNIIVLNGEIYNHLFLRKEYLKDHRFESTSDAETLVELIEKYGVAKTLPLLNGMFAFACFNKKENQTIIARDRFGIKPLFISKNNIGITFSSEITPIQQLNNIQNRLNYLSLYRLLVFWYVCEPETIYQDISAVAPGTFYTINKDLSMNNTKWWNPSFEARCNSEDDFIEKLKYLLKDSVSLRLLSDVPITSLLSGGIDSGLITYYWNKISNQNPKQVFTLGFNDSSYDETDNAQLNADKFNIPLIRKVLQQPTLEDLINLYNKIDQPIGNSSLIGAAALFEEVNNYSYKVCLTGDGADELFGGYPTYTMSKLSLIWDLIPKSLSEILKQQLLKIPVSYDLISLDYKIKQFLKSTSYKPHHPFYRSIFTPELSQEICSILGKYDYEKLLLPFFQSIKQSDLRGFSSSNRNLHLDFDTFLLNDHLPKIDRSSMAYGVEARNPFLDYRIYELAFSNPHFYKYSSLSLKKSLKKIGKSVLDKNIIKGKKKGLTMPISKWLTSHLGNEIESLILDSEISKSLFDINQIINLFKNHREFKIDNSREIWSIASFILWGETHNINL